MTATLTPATHTIYRFTVEQYHRLADTGVLKADDRVELLDGMVVRKMTKHTPHTTAGRKVNRALQARLPAGWLVITQDPITLATSEPEPDVAVLAGTVDDYAGRHPTAADVALVVEVADSSLSTDRGLKRRIYADAGLTVYWVVDVIHRQIEVFTDPHGSGDAADYASVHTYRPGDAVPLSVGGVALPPVPVAELLR